MLLYLQAFWQLIRFHHHVREGNFASLQGKVRDYKCAARSSSRITIERICDAIDVACIWYPATIFCLQRSAATTCLLRKYGVPAHMVLGAQRLPFRAHAWVEVAGHVVNDKPYVRETYAQLDYC
jgi:Transglutaminase-like superfamily